MSNSGKIIIEGVTDEGQTFRPSNWAERVSEQLCTYNKKHRLQYSPMLQPVVQDGVACVLLDTKLKETNPGLYQSIMNFAKSNHLRVCGEEAEGNGEDPQQ